MKKYHYMNGEVNDDMVEKLIIFINENQNNKMSIFLSSSGGDHDASELIIDIINSNFEKITLIAGYEISSAAFNIFFSFYGERYLMGCSFGLIHLQYKKFNYHSNGKLYDDVEDFHMKNFHYYKDFTLEVANSIGLSPKEMVKLLSGKDLLFNNKKLNEFINYQNKKLSKVSKRSN